MTISFHLITRCLSVFSHVGGLGNLWTFNVGLETFDSELDMMVRDICFNLPAAWRIDQIVSLRLLEVDSMDELVDDAYSRNGDQTLNSIQYDNIEIWRSIRVLRSTRCKMRYIAPSLHWGGVWSASLSMMCWEAVQRLAYIKVRLSFDFVLYDGRNVFWRVVPYVFLSRIVKRMEIQTDRWIGRLVTCQESSFNSSPRFGW